MRGAMVVGLLGVVGCGGGSHAVDMEHAIPDMFIQSGCTNTADCDDDDPCTADQCSATQGCLHSPKNCDSVAGPCTVGYCEATSGNCLSKPANDSQPCTDSSGIAGTCSQGNCIPLPQCNVSQTQYLDCTIPSISGATFGASVIDSYTGCPGATGLTGNELAFSFYAFETKAVTLSLSGTLTPLDLIVLDGSQCVSTASCEGSTVGGANKTLTFNAVANQSYLVVVDGQNGDAGNFTLNVDCNSCKPIQTLGCGDTVTGNSTGAMSTNANPGYPCDSSTPGPEDSYRITPSTDQQYKVTLTGLSTDLDLVVLDEYSGSCDLNYCEASSANTGTSDESLTFMGYSSGIYDVVVDSKTTGGPYTLSVDCPPSCLGQLSLDCSTLSDSRRNDDPFYSTNAVNDWQCDASTTGPEVVYYFYPSVTAAYTVTLTGLTADLDLVVESGTYNSCDPTSTCVGASTTAGTGDETVTFNANANQVYWIAVDGKNGATSPYTIKLRSTACPGPNCADSSDQLSCTYLEETRMNNDAAKSTNIVDAWSCDANTTGPEVVYTFNPPANGMYTVTLDGLTADLDLVVTESTSAFSCDPNSTCVQSSTMSGTTNESVTFAADTSHAYFVAVDGKNGAVGSYHVKLATTSCPAPICQNGYMNLDCSSNVSLTNRNDGYYATSDVSAWGACDSSTTGPEYAHLFVPPAPGSYTIEMIGLHDDLDLIVQETSATSPTCSTAAACYASSVTAGNADEKVTFTANAGKSYWIIVDGKNGATSRYTLAVTDGCPP